MTASRAESAAAAAQAESEKLKRPSLLATTSTIELKYMRPTEGTFIKI